MKHVITVIRDRVADAFALPFYSTNIGTAIRSFRQGINDPQTSLYQHPEDYDLYQVGTFDDQTGKFETIEPQQIAIGKEQKQKL